MEKKTIYFAKINLNSHIFEIYNDPKKLKSINRKIFLDIEENKKFHRENIYEDKEVYEADYEFTQLLKKRNVMSGAILKTADIFVQKKVKNQAALQKKAIPNNELIKFYYDIDKETILFSRTQRFGYLEFCIAFEGILNKCLSTEQEEYKINIELLRKGISVDEIKGKISKLKNIETLKINVIPPNPDEALLAEIQKNGEEFLNKMKYSNITEKSIILSSKAPGGLKMSAQVVQDELNMIGSIHSKLSTEKATANGYVFVEAKSKDGDTYSTKDSAPITSYIDESDMSDIPSFTGKCKKILALYLSRLI